MRGKQELVAVLVRFRTDEYEFLREEAHRGRTSMSELVRAAVRQQYDLPAAPPVSEQSPDRGKTKSGGGE